MPSPGPRKYEVALSYAGEQRPFVERVSARLAQRGVDHYYDRAYALGLWGKNLTEELQRIYERDSASVVAFVSQDYVRKQWTRHERRAAMSRAVQEQGVYLLPARFDDSELPGLVGDVAYVDLRGVEPEAFADDVVLWLESVGIR